MLKSSSNTWLRRHGHASETRVAHPARHTLNKALATLDWEDSAYDTPEHDSRPPSYGRLSGHGDCEISQ